MRKPLILVLFLFTLFGCASGAESPAQKLYATQATFNAYLVVVKSYVKQPSCSQELVIACKSPAVAAKLVELTLAAKSAIDTARSTIYSIDISVDAKLSAAAAAASSVRVLTAYAISKGIGNAT